MGDLQQASPIPKNIPKGIVTEWVVDDVQNWLATSMQLPQYLRHFKENEIAGDVLVHLDHDALKELEVTSVGHRLYILKQIYNLKIAHGVKFEKDDYVPISAPKLDDEEEPPQTFHKQLKERDTKIHLLESEIKRVNDQLFRLKEELIPVFKYTREKPLPTPDLPTPAPVPQPVGSSLARKFSTKKLFLGGRKPVNENIEVKPLISPTHLNGVAEERRPESPRSPTRTAIPITPGLHTPTPGSGSTTSLPETLYNTYPSLPPYIASPVTPRRMDTDETPTPRKRSNSVEKDVEKEDKANASKIDTKRKETTPKSNAMNPMKTFRVNQDDPCWKVLPAAMRKYQVNGREEDYRLFITYDNNGVRAERKLDLLEKPLIIFQQYQNEGKNPLFMLRYNGRRRHTENIAERDKKEEDTASPGIGTTNGDSGGKPSMMNGMI